MTARPRLYDSMLRDHLARHRQMAFVTGPRQVGKTTTCRGLSDTYLDWDNADDRRIILGGPGSLARRLGLDRLAASIPVAVVDEMHEFRGWKSLLKGFFDTYGERAKLLVTGSSRLDVYRRGGESLMGRYFLYRMHPFTVAEVVAPGLPEDVVRPPSRIDETSFTALWEHGGFPEPFVKGDRRFTTRWRALRRELLLREEVRDFTRIQELGQLETLGDILAERSGSPLVYSNLAQEVRVAADTCRRWVEALTALHFGFLVRPWWRNVAKSLRKEPKWFLRDWSGIADPGARAETFVACHLLKAVEGWTDLGLGRFDLRYLRDKEKREVDFVVVRDGKPWFLVEAKKADDRPSPHLAHFQASTGAAHAFQVVADLDYVRADCFGRAEPTVVPARTFLSQLL